MSEIFNDADYIEATIQCLFRDKATLQKALDLQLVPEDFGTINIYKAFASAALSIGIAPISPKVCLAKVKDEFKNYNIIDADLPTVLTFWEFIYESSDVEADYIRRNLADFVQFRRLQTLKVTKAQIEEAAKVTNAIDLRNTTGLIREFNPFKEMVLVEYKESLMTGFPAIDTVARGLNYQEFGLILGHSGSGKTAMAAFSAIQNAKQFRKVLYLSLEEPAENICNRVYSNVFRIPYSDLHKGNVFAQQDLKTAWPSISQRDREALINLKIHDLRDATPITARYIQNYLDKLYEDTGYHPDLVYIDQMDYLTSVEKYDSAWQKYEKVAFEIDDLCNHLIGGKHMFSVWLLHQAGGKMTRKFTNAEISGFKGVIKPTDMCLAIGRDSSQDTVVSIFSLKSRHAKNFQFDYLAELEFMNFEQQDKGAEDRAKEEEKDKKAARQGKGNFTNMPPRAPLLPAAGTGFHSAL